MPAFETTFVINASAERVWEVLTDLARYPEWNPQITSATGTLAPGKTIDIRLALPGRPAMNLKATIEQADAHKALTWRGHLLAPWFFQGYRRFDIAPRPDGGVTVTHLEKITGAFSPVFGVVMGGPVKTSQTALNEALKARAEARS